MAGIAWEDTRLKPEVLKRAESTTASDEELIRELSGCDDDAARIYGQDDRFIGAANPGLDLSTPDYGEHYKILLDVLHDAYDRAAIGKGKERHANDKPFLQQPIITEGILLGITPLIYQIRKKALESLGLTGEAKINELLDVMVYAAAAVIVLRGNQQETLGV